MARNSFPVEGLHLFKLPQTLCICVFTPRRWYKKRDRWTRVIILPDSQMCCCCKKINKKIQHLSAAASFLFLCTATASIHHRGGVLCHNNPEVVKRPPLMLRRSSRRMCHYQACSVQTDKNICAVAPWHHRRSLWVGKKSCNCNMLYH